MSLGSFFGRHSSYLGQYQPVRLDYAIGNHPPPPPSFYTTSTFPPPKSSKLSLPHLPTVVPYHSQFHSSVLGTARTITVSNHRLSPSTHPPKTSLIYLLSILHSLLFHLYSSVLVFSSDLPHPSIFPPFLFLRLIATKHLILLVTFSRLLIPLLVNRSLSILSRIDLFVRLILIQLPSVPRLHNCLLRRQAATDLIALLSKTRSRFLMRA